MSALNLEIISASAGSGKTFTLSKTLLEKVQQGQISVENLVAVTFTEAGAAELKSRIRARLLREGLHQEARQVDEAYISTIHSFGNRLLREFAFDLGLPLSTRMLNEDEQTQMIRSSMIDSAALIDMSERLAEFGYKTRMVGKKFVGPDGEFRKHLTAFIDLLRSTGRKDAEEQFLKRSIQWLQAQYGEVQTARTEKELAMQMQATVVALLEKYPTCPIELMGVVSKTGIADFRAGYRALEKAAKLTPLLTDWSLWESLKKLRVQGAKKPHTPEQIAFHELAVAVRDTAAELLKTHPGPLRHASNQLKSMIEGAGETLQGYARRKTEGRLVDFTDMVATAELALRHAVMKGLLTDRIQMLVVDEFQDTNPIQFAFLWHLIGSGVNSVLVGDSKQSIMGFQGADPRLFNQLIASDAATTRSLGSNWRSQPRLLQIINTLTLGLCKPEGMNIPYTSLDPQGKSSALDALHMLVIDGKPERNSNKAKELSSEDSTDRRHPSEKVWHARLIGQLLRKKLTSELRVVDRRTGGLRPLRGSDIAILCPTNSMMAVYAQELESMGLSVNLERPSWYETSEVILALELLKLLYNPDDLHAKLIVACSDLGRLDLQNALKQVIDGDRIELPVFEHIEQISVAVVGLSILETVELLLEKSGLLDQISRWEGAEQARANVLKLIGLAQEFSNAQPETLTSAGFYGRGIGTFVGWLKHINTQGVATACPRASYNDEHAIELTTWHKSKGREWPIVVVCGMDKAPKVTLPHAQIGYESFNDFAELIHRSEIQFTPRYDSEEKREALAFAIRRQAELVALRELYVAISRPREQLVLEWPTDHLKAKSDPKVQKRIQLLAKLANIEVGDQSIQIEDKSFDALVDRVSYIWQEQSPAQAPERGNASTFGRGLIGFSRPNNTERVRAQQNPSVWDEPTETKDTSNPVSATLAVTTYHQAVELGFQPDAGELGTLIHRLVELVMAGHDGVAIYRDRIERALAKYIEPSLIEALWGQAHALRNHLLGLDEAISLGSEVPIIGTLDGQTIVVGAMDLIVKGKNKRVIVDHKTGVVPKSDDELWAKYRQQMRVYCAMNDGYGAAINSIRSGKLVCASEV